MWNIAKEASRPERPEDREGTDLSESADRSGPYSILQESPNAKPYREQRR